MDVLRGELRRRGASRRGAVAGVAVLCAFTSVVAVGAAVDKAAPVVSSLRLSSLTPTSVVVSWHTNEPASSQLEYGTTNHYGLQARAHTGYTTGHQVTVRGLEPDTRYHYRVLTIDRARNAAYSKDATFTTPRAALPPPPTTTTTSTTTSTTTTSSTTTSTTRATTTTSTTTTTIPVAPPPGPANVGYHARPCGFDLNHNGIIGETADCHVGDGSTTNPFGDGTAVNMLYVDCQNGSDTTGDGTATKPYHSIQHALDVAPTGKPDIVAFTGICHEHNVTPKHSGLTDTYNRARTGDQATSFEYPKHPSMLIGWDHNHNGQYPPYDTGDTSILTGDTLQDIAINNSAGVSDFEFAHFTIADYGDPGTGAEQAGAFVMGPNGPTMLNHIYIHDLSIQRVDKGRPNMSFTEVFNFFNEVQFLAIENIETLDYGSYMVRGGPASAGPYRFQNITARAFGANASSAGLIAAVAAFKLWGNINGVEVIDNDLDANPRAWNPIAFGPGAYPSGAIAAAQCSHDWTIRSNLFTDWKNALTIQPDSGEHLACGSTFRSMNNVVFDRNAVRNTYDPWMYGDVGMRIENGSDPSWTVENVTISNNTFWTSTGWEACIWSNAGNDTAVNPGTIRIVGNTCTSDINRYAGIVIGNVDNIANPVFPQENYVVEDNVINGLTGGDENIATTFAPTNLILNGNVWSPNGTFVWNKGAATNLATWKTNSHEASASKQCNPVFVNAATGDLHLASTDTCAHNAGIDISASTNHDLDGQARPQSAWDAGADEIP